MWKSVVSYCKEAQVVNLEETTSVVEEHVEQSVTIYMKDHIETDRLLMLLKTIEILSLGSSRGVTTVFKVVHNPNVSKAVHTSAFNLIKELAPICPICARYFVILQY